MITRVTQSMLTGRELNSVQSASIRMAQAQEQMTTGRKINRPSDAPSDTTVALKSRSAIAEQQQYQRNASDGIAWLTTIDSAIGNATSLVQRAYTLAVAGANTGANGATAEQATADEVDQIAKSVMALANTAYLGRPVFGGTTAGDVAFSQTTDTTTTPPTVTTSYVGDDGSVNRRVGDGVVVRVDSEGTSVFGDPASGDSVFDHLTALSTALRASPADDTAIQQAITNLQGDITRFSSARASEGARMNQINGAVSISQDTVLSLQKVKTNVEDVDIAEATINMQSMTTAYQAALMAVAKTSQQSLLNFLS
jgi:flagellar hook-associated protein 3 FlgL